MDIHKGLTIPKLFFAIAFVTQVCLLRGQADFPEIPDATGQAMATFPPTILPLPPAPSYDSGSCWALNPVLTGLDAELSDSSGDIQPSLPHGRRAHNIPSPLPTDMQADVFFIHPTMLLEGRAWNADVHDEAMNAQVDEWPIRHQASAFLGAGRIFAPRYRQAHVRIFSLGDSLSWAAAEIAYQDVKTAFELYMKKWNQGRPIVIAGHSQGAFHGRRLLQELFDGTPLGHQLVAAYLPGMDMVASEFDAIPTCDAPERIGCLCTWMTYGEGFVPNWLKAKQSLPNAEPLLVVHPVTWKTEKTANRYEDHMGVVRPSFRLSKPGAVRAWITPDHVLWMGAPKLLGGRMFQRDNWHSGDINLFWHNIYTNVQLRTRKWHEMTSQQASPSLSH